MHVIVDFFYTAISFIVILSAIVFIHEFGHYFIAKWAGVKIETFSIGFGHEIWGFNDRSGTRWRLSALPLGGYVKMYGDASEASTPMEEIALLPEEEKRKTFHYKSLPRKAAIVAAGPAANFLLTIVILTGFIFTLGLPSSDPIIGEVMQDTPAQAAGLLKGDRILTIDGKKVENFLDIPRLIMTNLGTPVSIQLQRGDHKIYVALTPKLMKDKDTLGDEAHPVIGIKSKEIKYNDVGLITAVWEATRTTYHYCMTTLHAIGQMIVGNRSTKTIQGPIGIAMLSNQALEKGMFTVFLFVANFSASLGLINLFPVPMLDGGHLLYYAIEAIQGRPLARRFQECGFRIGMAMIAMLMLLALGNDIFYRVIPKLIHIFTS